MTNKLAAEQSAKQEALEKFQKAEHQCSMLQLDLKNTRDEVTTLKTELKTAIAKVQVQLWDPISKGVREGGR